MPWKPNLFITAFCLRVAVIFVSALLLASNAGKKEDAQHGGYTLRQVRR